MALPRNFTFGVATASYQIEGAVSEGGRTPSIWDTFSHTPGKIDDNMTGDVAVDHYHRWREDVQLMDDLGLDAYRLSLSWSRAMNGREVNPEGIAFYRELLSELRSRGIAPMVTLYHWDLPQELEDAGGWPVRETAYEYEHYARTMARELGDLVDTWVTINEPWCAAFLGYAVGVHAPGRTEAAASLAAAHHLNLAHGLGVKAIREELGEDAKVGIALNIHVVRPADPSNDGDLEAVARIERVGSHIFLGPLLEGAYPSQLIAETRHITDWSFVQPGDLQIARGRLDVVGMNYYYTQKVRPLASDLPEGERNLGGGVHASAGGTPFVGCEDVEFLEPEGPLTEMKWNIDPSGLTDLLVAMDKIYPDQPLAVMENGAAFPDQNVVDGVVKDDDRIDYLKRHFEAIEDAISQGADVRGYYLWSFIDNFEWAHGYTKRFGIVKAGPEALDRVPKASYHWYKDFIASVKAGGSDDTDSAADDAAATASDAADPAAAPGAGESAASSTTETIRPFAAPAEASSAAAPEAAGAAETSASTGERKVSSAIGDGVERTRQSGGILPAGSPPPKRTSSGGTFKESAKRPWWQFWKK